MTYLNRLNQNRLEQAKYLLEKLRKAPAFVYLAPLITMIWGDQTRLDWQRLDSDSAQVLERVVHQPTVSDNPLLDPITLDGLGTTPEELVGLYKSARLASLKANIARRNQCGWSFEEHLALAAGLGISPRELGLSSGDIQRSARRSKIDSLKRQLENANHHKGPIEEFVAKLDEWRKQVKEAHLSLVSLGTSAAELDDMLVGRLEMVLLSVGRNISRFSRSAPVLPKDVERGISAVSAILKKRHWPWYVIGDGEYTPEAVREIYHAAAVRYFVEQLADLASSSSFFEHRPFRSLVNQAQTVGVTLEELGVADNREVIDMDNQVQVIRREEKVRRDEREETAE